MNAALAENVAAPVQSLVEAERIVADSEKNRPIYWYPVPPSIATSLGLKKIGLVELTSDEYLLAANRCQGNMIRLSTELVHESVRYLDDKRINTGDGTAEAFWGQKKRGMSKLANLANVAYTRLHNATQEEGEYFLSGEEVTVG